MNPDTIIVQQEGEEVVVASANPDDQSAGQYVIQYVTDEGQTATEEQVIPMGVDSDVVTIEEAMDTGVTHNDAQIFLDATQAIDVRTLESQVAAAQQHTITIDPDTGFELGEEAMEISLHTTQVSSQEVSS